MASFTKEPLQKKQPVLLNTRWRAPNHGFVMKTEDFVAFITMLNLFMFVVVGVGRLLGETGLLKGPVGAWPAVLSTMLFIISLLTFGLIRIYGSKQHIVILFTISLLIVTSVAGAMCLSLVNDHVTLTSVHLISLIFTLTGYGSSWIFIICMLSLLTGTAMQSIFLRDLDAPYIPLLWVDISLYLLEIIIGCVIYYCYYQLGVLIANYKADPFLNLDTFPELLLLEQIIGNIVLLKQEDAELSDSFEDATSEDRTLEYEDVAAHQSENQKRDGVEKEDALCLTGVQIHPWNLQDNHAFHSTDRAWSSLPRCSTVAASHLSCMLSSTLAVQEKEIPYSVIPDRGEYFWYPQLPSRSTQQMKGAKNLGMLNLSAYRAGFGTYKLPGRTIRSNKKSQRKLWKKKLLKHYTNHEIRVWIQISSGIQQFQRWGKISHGKRQLLNSHIRNRIINKDSSRFMRIYSSADLKAPYNEAFFFQERFFFAAKNFLATSKVFEGESTPLESPDPILQEFSQASSESLGFDTESSSSQIPEKNFLFPLSRPQLTILYPRNATYNQEKKILNNKIFETFHRCFPRTSSRFIENMENFTAVYQTKSKLMRVAAWKEGCSFPPRSSMGMFVDDAFERWYVQWMNSFNSRYYSKIGKSFAVLCFYAVAFELLIRLKRYYADPASWEANISGVDLYLTIARFASQPILNALLLTCFQMVRWNEGSCYSIYRLLLVLGLVQCTYGALDLIWGASNESGMVNQYGTFGSINVHIIQICILLAVRVPALYSVLFIYLVVIVLAYATSSANLSARMLLQHLASFGLICFGFIFLYVRNFENNRRRIFCEYVLPYMLYLEEIIKILQQDNESTKDE